VNELNSIKWFSDKSSESYINGLKKFTKFIKGLPITIEKKKEEKMPTSNKCNGMIFVFTGFRSAELEEKIRDCGGTVGSGVNKKTTHLVMKEKGSSSGKEQKAIDMGITIFDKNEIEEFLG
jgi:NAD-dependent DNA ligase